jgi:restriction system protein
MIPDYQALMRPVLESAAQGEVRIFDVVDQLAEKLALSQVVRTMLLQRGKQTRLAPKCWIDRSLTTPV